MINNTNYDTEYLLLKFQVYNWSPQIVVDMSCRSGTGREKKSIYLIEERWNWCKDNCKHRFYVSTYIFWFFEDLHDAALFKLVWG